MVKLMTEPDLDAKQVEEVAQAIYRAELLGLFPRHPAAMAPVDSRYWLDFWHGAAARTRMSYRQQAIAALKASRLLEQVAELEQRVEAARAELAYTGEKSAQEMATQMRRVQRVLAKPLPEPEPIGIKP